MAAHVLGPLPGEEVIDACAAQTLEAEVVLVVSNNSRAGALRRAVAANIDTRHISIRTHGSEAAANQAIAEALSDTKADWVLLLGYMKKMGETILRQFSGRIINTHPALSPSDFDDPPLPATFLC